MSETIRRDSMEGFEKVQFGPKTRQIPEDWDVGQLGDNTYLKGRIGWHGLTEEDHLDEGEYFLVTGTDFEDGRVIWDSCAHVNEEWYEKDPNIQLERNDILVTKDGSIGKTAFVDRLPKQATLNNGLFVIRPLDNEYEPKFMYYILNSFYFDDFIETITAGSTISHLYQKDFVNFNFPLPPLPEQRRIADMLSTADEQIQQTDEIIEKTNELKGGLKQDCFNDFFGRYSDTKSTPMGKFPEQWNLRKISDVADVIDGSTFPKEYQGKESGDYPFIKVSDTNNSEKYVSDAKNYIDENDLIDINCNIQPTGTVILPKRGASILTNKRRILSQDSVIDNNQIGVNAESVNERFLYHYLCTVDMGRFVQKGAVKSINKSTITALKIPEPTIEEQNLIGNLLDSVDDKLARERDWKSHLQEFKRGLMQDLLTGKVRVNTDN